jgi:hypothetical protein
MGLLAALGGCASVTTKGPESRVGQEYFLPKAMFSAAVTFDPQTGFQFEVEGPVYVPDVGAGVHVLNHVPSPLGADDVTLAVQDGLLTSVVSKTDDRTPEIATGLGKTIGAIESATSQDRVLGPVFFDPLAPGPAVERLNRELRAWAAIQKAALPPAVNVAVRPPTAPARAGQPAAPAVAAPPSAEEKAAVRLRQWVDKAALGGISIEFDDLGATSSRVNSATANCTIGVCIRGVRPGILVAKFDGVTIGSAAVAVPNEVSPTAIPIQRTLFADRNDTLTFANGMLVKDQIVKGSEAEGLVTVIPNLLTGILDGAIGAIDKRASLAEKKFNYQKKLDEIEAYEAEQEKAKAEAYSEGPKLIVGRLPGLSALPTSPTGANTRTTTPPDQASGAGGAGKPVATPGGTPGSQPSGTAGSPPAGTGGSTGGATGATGQQTSHD